MTPTTLRMHSATNRDADCDAVSVVESVSAESEDVARRSPVNATLRDENVVESRTRLWVACGPVVAPAAPR